MYEDQIVGIHSRPGDLKVNVCRTKQLTNMRASGKDDNTNLVPPKVMSLEEAVEYVVDDEFVEVWNAAHLLPRFSTRCETQPTSRAPLPHQVTPEAIRLGKKPKESRFAKK